MFSKVKNVIFYNILYIHWIIISSISNIEPVTDEYPCLDIVITCAYTCTQTLHVSVREWKAKLSTKCDILPHKDSSKFIFFIALCENCPSKALYN